MLDVTARALLLDFLERHEGKHYSCNGMHLLLLKMASFQCMLRLLVLSRVTHRTQLVPAA